jgi:signal transduction histidine kinase
VVVGPNPAKTISGQELINSLGWLIKLRWLAGASVIGLTLMVSVGFGLALRVKPLYLVGLSLFVYNVALQMALAWMHRHACSETVYQWFARFQIGLDWMAMTVLIHYSGGISSPAIIFFMFHITIASLLLPHDKGFLYVALAPILVGAVAWSEYHGVIEHVTVFGLGGYRNPWYVAAVLFFFACAAYVMAYFSMAISRRLRRREDEVAGLYDSVRAVTSTLDLREVLNRLTEATSRALGCKAASIRLLNKTGSHLEMVAACGLSDSYRDHAAISLASAVIDREALSGKTVLIANASRDSRVRFPEKVKAEGIESILSTPLMSKRGLIGVLRAYGATGHRFTARDGEFLAAIALQGTTAMENAEAYSVLEDLTQQKSEFIRMVTHELRSPVQVAQSLLGVLSSGYAGGLNDKQVEIIQRTSRRIQYLQNLVDDLLNLAAGRTDVMAASERSPVSLVGLFKDLYERFDPIARSKGLRLVLEAPEASMEIWGRRDELGRLLGNLLDNALKYTAQGVVAVRAEASHQEGLEGFVRLEISDTGIGIPADVLPRIYEEFFRAENAKAHEERGTGLGLSIVNDLINRYGGHIEAQSVEGQGSTFTVWLPLLARGKKQAQDSEPQRCEQA